MFKIGIDVGGTFTDLVVTRPGEAPRLYKTPSTPQDPSEGVMNGLLDVAQDYGLEITELLSGTSMIIHGTTVATNTLVERKGAKVGLITTGGFRDLLEMREGMKEDRYNLRMKQMEALVPRYLRIGVPERTRADGSIKTELDEAAVAEAVKGMLEEGVEGLAVCFLFSYLNPEHERRVGQIIEELAPGLYTSLSHEILPQIKEFDRLSTTVVNSYVGPVFGRYLTRLNERLAAFSDSNDILIMQSNGGVTPIDDAKNQAVKAILSGPAGGVAGAKSYGDLVGEANLIGFDMGGTSTDISLIEDGVPHVTTEQFEAGWKIAVPMIDIHTLGAGGGSIAAGRSRWDSEGRAGERGRRARARLLQQGWRQAHGSGLQPCARVPFGDEFPGWSGVVGQGQGGRGDQQGTRRAGDVYGGGCVWGASSCIDEHGGGDTAAGGETGCRSTGLLIAGLRGVGGAARKRDGPSATYREDIRYIYGAGAVCLRNALDGPTVRLLPVTPGEPGQHRPRRGASVIGRDGRAG